MPTQTNTVAAEGYNAINKAVVYEIGQDIYDQFIVNPSYDILNQQENRKEINIYSLSITAAGSIRQETISPDSGTAQDYQDYDDGTLPIWGAGGLTVYKSLVDFAGNTAKIKEYLNQNGVTANIEGVALITGTPSPNTIWVKTDKENYFITVDEQQEDYINDPEKTTYVYRLYDHSAYLKKFREKACRLIVKGKDITDGNYVKLYYNYANLPLIAVMKELGAKVERQSKTTLAITYGNKHYILDTTSCSLDEIKANGTESTAIPPVGGGGGSQVIGNELVVDDNMMWIYVKFMGAKMNIDYKQGVINIG